ncbi:MAG: phosphopyruvate hydratase [Candidatus Kerfeldbacteria bacterium]|nr:phosphopyruvate hydratase [Candidatus Kerfeldbacteria bacterium]
MTIEHITSRQILDSRGRPTLETTVTLDTGVSGTAAVPSGASTGSHEAFELRDQSPKHYGGLGVHKAIDHVTGPIAKATKGFDVRQQRGLDSLLVELDGTVNKSKLGANALLSVSLAVSRAAAALQRQPLYRWIQQVYELPAVTANALPRPMMNVLNGGRHADTELKIQEFLIMPTGQTAAGQIERGALVYRALAELLTAKHLRTTVGDEGGFAPALTEPTVAFDFVIKAITAAGYQTPDDIEFGLDIAASEWYNASTERYDLAPNPAGLSSEGVAGLLEEWLRQYPLTLIEDPLAEDDWVGWQLITAKLGSRLTLVGDDLFTTNPDRLERGLDSHVANAVVIKPNQAGTLTEAVDTAVKARAARYALVVGNRSGETNDPFIVDLAVALGAEYLKAGAPARGERVAKYNRLLAIADELGQ